MTGNGMHAACKVITQAREILASGSGVWTEVGLCVKLLSEHILPSKLHRAAAANSRALPVLTTTSVMGDLRVMRAFRLTKTNPAWLIVFISQRGGGGLRRLIAHVSLKTPVL